MISITVVKLLNKLQGLEEVFIPLVHFHIFSPYNHKLRCILLGFYVIDKHKVVNNCQVDGKRYMVFKSINQ